MSQVKILPGLFFMLIIVGAIALRLYVWHKRVQGYRALAEKCGLHDVRSDNNAPNPGVSGLLLPANYSHFLVGRLDGVDVAAFDYRIGIRNVRLGAGVGARIVVDPQSLRAGLSSGLDVKQNGGWTFVYTTPLPFARLGYGLGPDEMEYLWRKLLDTTSFTRAEQIGPSPSLPGEIHIRPRHRV